MTLAELRQRRAQIIEQARALMTTAQAETRSMTPEEETRFNELHTQADAVNRDIDREERQQAQETQIFRAAPPAGGGGGNNEPGESGFRSFGEFLREVRYNPHSDTVRAMAMETGDSGGFMVPREFQNSLLQVQPGDAIVRPSATVIGSGNSPDAAIDLPYLDQSANMYGGVEVAWIGEGADKPETSAKLGLLSLNPKEVAAHIVVTDKLLRNAPSIGPLIEGLLRKAMFAAEDYAFISGDGVAKPLGYLKSKAVLEVVRKTAGTITYEDIIKMYSVAKMGGKLEWVCSQTILPALLAMADSTGRPLWIPSPREGVPDTLMGLPVRWSERNPLLGARGDLSLVDLSYYVIKDGFGIAVAVSEHVHFKSNKSVIKAFWNVDGQAWINSPIKLENGSSVSPFVVLK